jgi:hypothetical protein
VRRACLRPDQAVLKATTRRGCRGLGVASVCQPCTFRMLVSICPYTKVEVSRRDDRVGLPPSAYPRESNDTPREKAFCRVAPSVRLSDFAILAAGVRTTVAEK